jgi:putative endonuclease
LRENTADSKSLGKKGEDIACRALKKDKYRIAEKNFRCRQGEIDIIAEDKKGVLCFVEVKARSRDDFGLPVEAVTHHKQKRLLAAAFVYLEKNKIKSRDMRFDVVSVDLNRGESRIIKNAFEADL